MGAEKYTINFVDPTKSTITVLPNSLSGPTTGTRKTDVDLIGMGHSLWGEIVLENFIHILENFACSEDIHSILAIPSASTFTVQGDVTPAFISTGTFNIFDSDNNDAAYVVSSSSYSSGTNQTTVTISTVGSPTPALIGGGVLGSAGNIGIPNKALAFSPITPIEGQMWYNQTRGQINVYQMAGSPVAGSWKRVGGITFSDTAPTSPTDGDLWWETTSYAISSDEYGRNLQIYVGGSWVRVVENYLPRDGSKTMTGDLDMNSNQINLVGNPVVGTDGMSRDYADGRYVELVGDIMAGDLNMNNNQINLVGTPQVSTDGMSVSYADGRYVELIGDTMQGPLNMNNKRINLVGDPTAGTDGMSRDYADARYAGASASYPIGSVYISVVSTNPNTLLGFGTWSQIAQGRMLIGQNGGDPLFLTPEATGGSKNAVVVDHTHTINTAGAHTHGYWNSDFSIYPNNYDVTSKSSTHRLQFLPTSSAGNHSHSMDPPDDGVSGTNQNLPPYFVTYMWKRTA